MLDDSSFGRRFFQAFVARVDATFYLPKHEAPAFTEVGDSIMRPGWYLPFAVTRVVQPFNMTYAHPTPEEPFERLSGTHDFIYDMSDEAVSTMEPFEVQYRPKYAPVQTYRTADGQDAAIPMVYAAHEMSRLQVNGLLTEQDEAYFGSLNSRSLDDRLVEVAPGEAFVVLNCLLQLFDDHTYRYVQETLPRQQRRASGMPSTSLHFRVVPRGERTLYKREELQTIAQIKRRMHVVRGFERTYKSDRYVNVQGMKQFIKPHIRGTLGTAVQIPDYRVEV
jgi:hypothetical protein